MSVPVRRVSSPLPQLAARFGASLPAAMTWATGGSCGVGAGGWSQVWGLLPGSRYDWEQVHDARRYKNVKPQFTVFQRELAAFWKRHWEYYRRFLAYREVPGEGEVTPANN